MSKGSPPPTNQTSPDTTWLSGAPVVTTFVVNTALGPNFDSAASSVTSFSMEAGARGRDGLELNTVRPLTATVRQDVAGVRLMRSLRWVTSRRSATGAAMSSGTRRADRTGVIGDCTLEVPAATADVDAADARSAWTATAVEPTMAIASAVTRTVQRVISSSSLAVARVLPQMTERGHGSVGRGVAELAAVAAAGHRGVARVDDRQLRGGEDGLADLGRQGSRRLGETPVLPLVVADDAFQAVVRIEGTFALHAPLVALDAHAQEDDAVDVGVARRHLEHRRNRVLR